MNKEKWNKLVKFTGENPCEMGDIYQGHRIPTLDEFSKIFPKGKEQKVLVVGAGNGSEVSWLRERNFNAEGIDLDDMFFPDDLSKFLRVCDMHETYFENETFDIIYCSHTFEHSVSPLLLLLEWNRILKTNGMAFISIPEQNERWLLDDFHFFIPNLLEMQAIAGKAGFRILKYLTTTILEEGNNSQIFLIQKFVDVNVE